MLRGEADVDRLAERAPTVPAFLQEPVRLDDVVCLQATLEMRRSAREALLPPSLHPTSPPTLGLQAWQVGSSPWGAFTLALARVSCRSGVRARGYSLQAYVSTEAAARALREGYGMPVDVADVRLRQGFDRTELVVRVGDPVGDREVLALTGLDPEPLGLDDVQYTGTLNLAHTPMGLRLVQMEVAHRAERVERLRGRLAGFDAAAWGDERLDPYLMVAASVATETLEIPPVRFVCKVDELAFTGTEPVT